MSSKSIYGFEISGMQRMLESMSPVLKSVQMSNAVAAAMPTSMINQQLFDATQPIIEAAERWNQMFNTVEMIGLRESLMRTSKILGSYRMVQTNNIAQSLLKFTSLQNSVINSFKGHGLGVDPAIFATM